MLESAVLSAFRDTVWFQSALFRPLTAAGATLALGLPVAVGVCRTVSSLSYGGTIVPYQFPLPEMALFLGVLFGLELLLSGWSIRREEKDGLLERIGQRP